MKETLNIIKGLFTPNKQMPANIMVTMAAFQAITVIVIWQMFSGGIVPSPSQIAEKWWSLLMSGAILEDLSASCLLIGEAMVYTVCITLFISYATVLPFFKYVGVLVTKFRFLTITGLSYLFTLMSSSGYELKLNLLIFGMTVFFVTTLVSVLENTDKMFLNHARTLGFSEWRVTYEVKLLGNVDKIFDVIRQNFAISWTMLTMVEGLVRAGGGIGVSLLNQNKSFDLAGIFAFQFTVLIAGMLFDYSFKVSKELVCPYSIITLDKK